jgi:cytochrome c-type biogenesis protein CcmH/NrfG
MAMSESARRIAELQRELAGNPASRQFYQLGELLRREGRGAEAAEALRSGLAHHPRYVAAWVALGRACVDAGQATEAVHSLEQALALDPQNPVAWRLLGEAHLALGERPAALEAMKHSLELVPGDAVLQSAVDAIAAELASPAPPEEPHEAEPPAAALIEPGEVFGEAEEVELAVPAAEEAPAPPPAETAPEPAFEMETEASEPPAAFPAPPAPEPAFEMELQAPEPPAAPPAPKAPPRQPAALEAPPMAGQETADDLFGGPPPVQAPPEPPAAPLPAPEVPAAAPAEAAPALQPTGDAELFTAPETEEAPVLLKKVLQASAPWAAATQAPAQPPASLTLARLYVQQQALNEAVRVLERLLEREPGNVEARDLLALVRDMLEPMPAAPPKLSSRERKIAALQRWLASLTLGQERATR